MKKIIIILLLTIAFPIYAEQKVGDGGAQVMSSVNMGFGARPIAMGGAYSALADDVYALIYNPAGLSKVFRVEVTFQHNLYLLDMYTDFLGVAYPTSFGTFGLGGTFVTYGDFQTTRADNTSGAGLAKYRAWDFIGHAAYSQTITDNILFGVTAKILYEDIQDYDAIGAAMDVGVIVKPVDGIDFSFVYQNIGTKLRFLEEREKLPEMLTVGASFELMPFNRKLYVNLDARKMKKQKFEVNVGSELWVRDNLALRVGFDSSKDIDVGVSGGAGFNYKNFFVDYAFRPVSRFENSHVVSGIYKF